MKASPNRSHVITVASQLFLQKGLANTSMDEVVAASGVSKSNIYYHFKSKEELIVAVLDYRMNLLNERLERIFTLKELSVKARVELIFTALAEELEGRSCVGGCPIFSLLSAQIPEINGRIHSFVQVMQAMAEKLLTEGIAGGEFKKDISIPETAALFITVMEGAIMIAESQGNTIPLINAGKTLLHLLQV